MKKVIFILSIFFACTQAAYAAVCSSPPSPFENWTTSVTITTKNASNVTLSATRYAVTAPCKVYLGVAFNVKAWVKDTTWANTYVAYPWNIQDTYSSSSSGKHTSSIPSLAEIGSGWLKTDASKEWQFEKSVTYNGTPYDHRIEFTFIDNGNGDEPVAHHISSYSAGGLSVDPYLITLAPNYTLWQSQQGSTVIPATVLNPNGATLTCRWREGATVLQSQTLSSTGTLSVPINLASLASLSLGVHVLTLEVSDGAATATANISLTVNGGTPVPLLEGWWLLPGALAGIGILIRRRKR